MTNSELRKLIFIKITSLGYKIKNIENPDGYFICDMGKDSVTHFRIKGHHMSKHWKFGLWVNEDFLNPEYVEKCKTEYNTKNVIQLFAQYDTCIDKFKPSRSALCLSWSLNDINDYLNGNDKDIYGVSYTFNKIETMLGFMCKHPLLAYEEFCGDYAGYYNNSFLWNFIKYEGKTKIRNIKTTINKAIWIPYIKIKCLIAKHNKIINNIEITNFEKENPGWSTGYIYEIEIKFAENVSEEKINKWLSFWWHKSNYGKRGHFDCIAKITDVTQIGNDDIWYLD